MPKPWNERMNHKAQNDAAEIRRLNQHMMLTILPLQADVDFATVQLVVDRKSQFWRRTVIRCGLALVEATLWNMKHILPTVATFSGVQLTPDELEMINEEKTRIKDGQPVTRPNLLPFRDNVKATFSIFAKVHGISISVDYDSEFDALCHTYELRNRLMHPKRPFDPNVSDPDIDVAQRGAGRFNRSFQQIMKQCEQEVPKFSQSR
ncbi:MAG: hypothetical protein ABSH34_10280 [Verrucomicrobiota bacterium]